MTTGDPIRPDNPPHLTASQMNTMRHHIEQAIDSQRYAADRKELRRRMFAGALKVTSRWSVLEGDKGLDLHYLVETKEPDGRWAALVRIHYSRLFLTEEQLEEELRLTAHLNGLGIPENAASLLDGD